MQKVSGKKYTVSYYPRNFKGYKGGKVFFKSVTPVNSGRILSGEEKLKVIKDLKERGII
jgi:hypothetical protein